MPHELRASADGRGLRVAIAVARFNPEVTERLLAGALAALHDAGVADGDVTIARVAGAFELPLASRWLAGSGRFDAVVALGAVIRGETDHYDWVCAAATDGLLRVTLDTGLPVAFGVLTCATEEQALARAGGTGANGANDGTEGNKGADVARAALEMARLRRAMG